MGETLVFGHKNPDTDSIASAIGYAWYANQTSGGGGYVPCRLGELNAESAWALERFELAPPRLLAHVRMTALDAMNPEVMTATPATPLLEVAQKIVRHELRAVPIVEDERVVGIVSQRELGRRYLEESDITGFEASPIDLGKLAAAVEGTIVTGDPASRIAGRVLIGASEPKTMASYIKPGDVVIVGDRVRGQHVAVDRRASSLIVTAGAVPEKGVVAEATAGGVGVIRTPLDTYSVARHINLSVPASAVMDPEPLVVAPDDLLCDVRADLIASPHREALVCDESGALLGLISRTDLARAGQRTVALVDHSESSQSAEGIREARVVAIVDHHRLGDVESAEPIFIVARPVGATSSIVANMAKDGGHAPPAGIAGVLLAAILSDTILLNSPTTSALDRDMAAWLARLADVDVRELGTQMLASRMEGSTLDPERAVRQDLKLYNFSGQKVGIAQLETVDAGAVLERRGDLRLALERLLDERELDIAVLMVTDVIRHGSVLLAAGRTRAVERAFGLDGEPERFLEGVLSRKQQVAAVLARTLGAG